MSAATGRGLPAGAVATHTSPWALVVRHRWVLGAHAALLLVWSLVWRLPVLMGDDRFFAVASGLPGGRQTWAGIRHMVVQCVRDLNGRWVDGFGTVFFALGDTGLRLAMPVLYLVLTVLLWEWVQLSRVHAGLPRFRLSDGRSPASWLAWLAVATVPLLLTGINLAHAGESVFLMASVWNYVLPIDLLMVSLLPVLRHVAGVPVSRWAVLPGSVGLVLALTAHEMLMVAGVMFVGVLLVAGLRRTRQRWVWPLVLLATVVGVVAKLATPGLWARGQRYADPRLAMVDPLQLKASAMAVAVGSLAVRDALELLLVPLMVLVVVRRHRGAAAPAGRQRRALRATAITCLVSLGAWLVAARTLLLVRARLTAAPERLFTLGLDRVWVVVAAFCVFGLSAALLVFLTPARCTGLLARASALAGLVCLAAGAAGATPHYALIHRTFYVTLLLLVVAVVAMLVQQLDVDGRAAVDGGAVAVPEEADGPAPRRVVVADAAVVLLVVCLALAGRGLATSWLQLSSNRQTWAWVEDQVDEVHAGRSTKVIIPRELPCPAVTWYFGTAVDERVRDQWRTYYALPPTTAVEAGSVPTLCGAPS